MTSFAQRIRPDNDNEAEHYGVEPLHANMISMFELRTKDGGIHMLEYSQLTKVRLDPTDCSMDIMMINESFTIKGRNLQEILPFFKTHRLSFIQEDYSGLDDGEASVFVEKIEVSQRIETDYLR